MRVAFLDPFSGASGDMLLGALIDAGARVDEINARLAGLDIPDAAIHAESVTRNSITGTLATVRPETDYHVRAWPEIRAMITGSRLATDVIGDALRIFGRLAAAEAAIHALPVDSVQFHEVGALDTIVDIVGVVIGLRVLEIDRLHCGPLHLGGGTVDTAHGRLPVPAPATARLLAEANAPIASPMPGEGEAGELVTPTAAAILATLATFDQPGMRLEGVGIGFGARQLPWANMTRLFIGELVADDQPSGERLIILETNIDDMNPQFVDLLAERLFAGGALDVWTSAIGMKKNRPALQVSALVRPADAESLAAILIEQSTTLGVRQTTVNRIAADRQMESVETRWGRVRVKLKIWNGRVIDLAPEYDDCAAIARAQDVRIREIWNEAYRIGEVYVGRRVESPGTLARLDTSGAASERQRET